MKHAAIPQRSQPTQQEIIAREIAIQLRNGALWDDVVDFARKVIQQRKDS